MYQYENKRQLDENTSTSEPVVDRGHVCFRNDERFDNFDCILVHSVNNWGVSPAKKKRRLSGRKLDPAKQRERT
jgi:hypothetical protein